MQTINQIKLQVILQVGKVLHDDPEGISLEVWGDAYIIKEHVGSFLNGMWGEIQDQIEEDLEDV